MKTEELYDLLDELNRVKSEGQYLEIKAAERGCPKKLFDTISGFSNQDGGGVILFGVNEEDEFNVCGVYNLQDLQTQVTEQCNQMEPPVRALFTSVEIKGKIVCSAEIPGIDIALRPCYYRGKGLPRGAYTRVGNLDMPMTDYEVYSFESFRRHQHDDERPVDRATMDMMNKEDINSYIDRKRKSKSGFSKLSIDQAMEMLKITTNGVPTLAAIMNFCVYPQGFFPQFAIQATVIPGKEIGEVGLTGERFLDNERIEGTIAEMTEAVMSFCKKNMKHRTKIDANSGKREDYYEYPPDAIREIILNAIIHRDYSHFTEGTSVSVMLFEDRMEVHSPGSLYGRMTVEQLGVARPDIRNPGLAVMAEMLSGTENRYSGIPTIRRSMKAYGLMEPVFENRRNEFVVTLYNSVIVESDEKSDLDGGIAGFCSVPRSRQEIADFIGIKTLPYVTKNYIEPLVKKNVLNMTMPDRPKSRYQKYYATKRGK